MAIPLTGTVSLGVVRSELQLTGTSPFSLDSAENGTYVVLNRCSPVLPSSGNPASLSEWRGYDHFRGCTCTGLTGATAFSCTGGTAWNLNVSLTAPEGGFLTVSLTGLVRTLVNGSYPGSVELRLGPTYSQAYVTQMESTTCFSGTADTSSAPAVIAGGATFPASRVVNWALPAGTTAAQVRINCGGANDSFSLSGTVSVGYCGSSSICQDGIFDFYIGAGGRAYFYDTTGFTQSGEVSLYNYASGGVGSTALSLATYTMGGTQSELVGSMACGTTYSGISVYGATAYSVREVTGASALGSWSYVYQNGCPAAAAPTDYAVTWSHSAALSDNLAFSDMFVYHNGSPVATSNMSGVFPGLSITGSSFSISPGDTVAAGGTSQTDNLLYIDSTLNLYDDTGTLYYNNFTQIFSSSDSSGNVTPVDNNVMIIYSVFDF